MFCLPHMRCNMTPVIHKDFIAVDFPKTQPTIEQYKASMATGRTVGDERLPLLPHAIHPERLIPNMMWLCYTRTHASRYIGGHHFVWGKNNKYPGAQSDVYILSCSADCQGGECSKWRMVEVKSCTDDEGLALYHAVQERGPKEPQRSELLQLMRSAVPHFSKRLNGDILLAPKCKCIWGYVLGQMYRRVRWVGFPSLSEISVREAHPLDLTAEDHGLTYLCCGEHSLRNFCGRKWTSLVGVPARYVHPDVTAKESFIIVELVDEDHEWFLTVIGPKDADRSVMLKSKKRERDSQPTQPDNIRLRLVLKDFHCCLFYFRKNVPKLAPRFTLPLPLPNATTTTTPVVVVPPAVGTQSMQTTELRHQFLERLNNEQVNTTAGIRSQKDAAAQIGVAPSSLSNWLGAKEDRMSDYVSEKIQAWMNSK